MKFNNVALESIKLSLPEEIWSSESIEQRLEPIYSKFKVSIGRLELMTGIKERRVWTDNFLPSQEGAKVAKSLLKESTIKRDKIDLLIHSGVCRDRLEPATAAYVHQALNLPHSVQFMDISNACLGFMNAIIMSASMIENGLIRSALIVTAETSRNLINNTVDALLQKGMSRKKMKQYFANLTIGSGAVAAVLCHKDMAPDAPRIVGGVAQADSSQNTLCEGGSSGGHEMLTDSEALLKAGISLARKTWEQFAKTMEWGDDMVNHYICHQVGKMHQNALYDGLKIDKEKDFSTYPYLGNMGSAALPGTLASAIEKGLLLKNERTALLGIGSGISSIMLGIES